MLTTPGVGDYDLTGFKSLNKVSATAFAIESTKNNRSRSPLKNLGGPTQPVMNTMNQISRKQRGMLFFPEHESALLNQTGPGPAQYNSNKARIHLPFQPNFTIPRADRGIVKKPRKTVFE